MRKNKNKIWVFLAVTLFSVLVPAASHAGSIELSVGFNFSQSQFANESYSWTRRWGLSAGYYLGETTEIELSYQDVTERNVITNYEDTTFFDKIYSASVNQSLLGKTSPIQPYVKAGFGQLNRDAQGTYYFAPVPYSQIDSLTGVIGVGARLYFTRAIALRAEATSYLAQGMISKWQDNVATTIGLSAIF